MKPKTPTVRGRPKKQIVEPSPEPVQQESHSPIYATIQRNRPSIDRASFATVVVNSATVRIPPSNETVNTTPKPSTFKRIQSFFRATPSRSSNSLEPFSKNLFSASTNSATVNRVAQVKNTVVAFGSSTPTNRLPPSIVKTPGPTSTPKSKYNLRTRLFNPPICKEDDGTRIKKPLRTRK